MVPKIAVRSVSTLSSNKPTTRQSSPSLSIISSSSSTGESNGNKRKNDDGSMDREKKRKLMNRVAAQQSRDRKKQHMDELEKELERLRAENASLQKENLRIREEKNSLLEENGLLKNCQQVVKLEEPCIALVPDMDLDECVISSSTISEISAPKSTFESAEGTSRLGQAEGAEYVADAVALSHPADPHPTDLFLVLQDIWKDLTGETVSFAHSDQDFVCAQEPSEPCSVGPGTAAELESLADLLYCGPNNTPLFLSSGGHKSSQPLNSATTTDIPGSTSNYRPASDTPASTWIKGQDSFSPLDVPGSTCFQEALSSPDSPFSLDEVPDALWNATLQDLDALFDTFTVPVV